ncbi:MAG: ABC transporter substrate-binding protein [Vicinamibacterales bacterium]
MSRSFAGLGFVACLVAFTWGCGPRPVPTLVLSPSPPPAPDPPSPPLVATALPPDDAAVDCALIAVAGDRIATVALGERVDPANAPRPSNDSERLLFRQLYETLVRIDCEGRLRPGLAASWRLDTSSRTWTVTLRDNARFSDGTPVAAADVVSSWRGPQARRYVESIIAVDDRALAITLRGDGANAPLVLADTDLAIARRVPGSSWPLGTRDTRIVPEQGTPNAGGRSVVILASDNLPSVRFLVAPGRDGRDFLDEGVDLLLTGDPAALDYAATLPQFLSVPLAWQRTYVLLSPWRGRSLPPLSAPARQTLADEAVRGEARGAESPFWWQGLPNCELAALQPQNQPAPQAPMPGRIVYERSDDAARDLAERFVGLGTYQRAIGLTGDALALSQARGTEAGYVVPFNRVPLDPCQELRNVVDRLKWLDPDTIVPLVDTRLRAIARRGRSGVTAEWDGGLVIR